MARTNWEHATLVDTVKDHQRASEHAREAWRNYCDTTGDGVRDPKKHSKRFLCAFLDSYDEESRVTSGMVNKEHSELLTVRSSLRSLEAEQITLEMPSSETNIMREVVDLNSYSFAPGQNSALRQDDVLLDVGAHVGVVAALALRTEGTRVVCIEPHPLTFGILQQNMQDKSSRVTLVNKAVSKTSECRSLYTHRGTNNPSRLFFSSLFDTRSHDDHAIDVECVSLQSLLDEHVPTVIKIDAEGAECYIEDISDFKAVRLMVVEWDWTHNRERSKWKQVEAHLRGHDFKIHVKGFMPSFDEQDRAVLTDSRGNKRGKTGMIFTASRKTGKSRTLPAFKDLHRLEGDAQKNGDEGAYLFEPGAQPPLPKQLDALTLDQMTQRLEAFGQAVRTVDPKEFVPGFQVRRRAELREALCAAYVRRAQIQPRIVVREKGLLLPTSSITPLLEAVRMMDWKENVRPNVSASGYVVLKRPYELTVQPRWQERDPRAVRRKVWELAEAVLRSASPRAAQFQFTALAVSKNFHGSPHVDKNDLSVQYALSLGTFDAGGELCVEENAFLVRALDTHNRLACIDGRFPHWVSGYEGERYSVIFYRSSGVEDPRSHAVHLV